MPQNKNILISVELFSLPREMSEEVRSFSQGYSPWNDHNTVSKSVRNNEFFAYRANALQCTRALIRARSSAATQEKKLKDLADNRTDEGTSSALRAHERSFNCMHVEGEDR